LTDYVVCSSITNEDEIFRHTIERFGAINFDGFGQEATTYAPVSNSYITHRITSDVVYSENSRVLKAYQQL